MKFATAFLFVAIATSAGAQEVKHAPTVDVCRADAAVWWSNSVVDEYEKSEDELASNGKYIPNPVGDLPIKEVLARRTELIECEDVDKDNHHTYSSAIAFYSGVSSERYQRFLQRHGLFRQFVKEDAAGVR